MPKQDSIKIDSIKILFPCKNCVILLSYKYRGMDFKLNKAQTRVSVFDGTELVATEAVEKMVPGCRFCRALYLHQIGRI